MDLPVWQALYDELRDKNLIPIAVAFDSAGTNAVKPWIEAAHPTSPCLIDRGHIVAELYDMVNVPTAVWIDERGRIVRPGEVAGYNDAFRRMDRVNLTMSSELIEEFTRPRAAYLDALRDWVAKGPQSRFALSEQEVLRRMHTPSDDHVWAAANFRMGEYLAENGHADAARPYFDEAVRLRPESRNYKRQAWALEDPMKAAGPEFWSAVDSLGEREYYPVPKD